MPEYLLTITTRAAEKPIVTERIVRAKNEAAAVKHVVTDTIAVDRPSGDDYMRLAKLGVEIENAA